MPSLLAAAKKINLKAIKLKKCKKCKDSTIKDRVCDDCSKCFACCECVECDSCGETIEDKPCEHCDCCDSCCGCSICDDLHCNNLAGCGNDNYGGCDYCSDHCQCGEFEGDMKPFVVKTPRDKRFFNNTRLVGVEWEFNQANKSYSPINKWCREWGGSSIEDGSCGEEIVTPPVAGDHIINCLTDLGKALKKSDARSSDDCGLHVHVDARDFAWVDMYRLLAVYAYVEPIMYILAGQDRSSNDYCFPCGKKYKEALASNDDIKGAVIGVSFEENDYYRSSSSPRDRQRAMPGKKAKGRYKGLNICPWLAGRKLKAPDTTVEFRMHQYVNKDHNEVIEWAKLCAQLVDWVAKASDREAMALPKSALRALCEVIAPLSKEYIINKIRAWRKMTKVKGRGKRKAREVKRLIKFSSGKTALEVKKASSW